MLLAPALYLLAALIYGIQARHAFRRCQPCRPYLALAVGQMLPSP